MSLEAACRNPVQTVLSGPAGGVSGASVVATRAGFERILTFDMGGTSTDVAVCVAGRPEITRETSVGDFPVRAPAVDVASIGAGGGSIAYIAEATGALRVGPQSAGAVPGPACYGHGGTGGNRHGRQRRPGAPPAAAPRRRHGAGRGCGTIGRSHGSQTLAGPAWRRPRARSWTWSTRRCWARCGSSRFSGAVRPATSPSLPSAAPAACTRTHSRRSSARTR